MFKGVFETKLSKNRAAEIRNENNEVLAYIMINNNILYGYLHNNILTSVSEICCPTHAPSLLEEMSEELSSCLEDDNKVALLN